MSIKTITREFLRTKLRLRLRDKSEPYLHTTTELDDVINQALRLIVGETECIEETASIIWDMDYSYADLVGSDDENLDPNYMSLKRVRYKGIEIFERDSQTFPDQIISGFPDGYYLWNERIYLNAIPGPTTELITNDDDSTFENSAGNWVPDAASAFTSESGGYDGNDGQFVAGAGAGTTLLQLASAYIDDLVVDDYYKLTLRIKKGAAWNGGVVSVTIDGNTTNVTLTTSYQLIEVLFQATAISVAITITSAVAPTAADVFRVDTVQLRVRGDIECDFYKYPDELTADDDTPPAKLKQSDQLILNWCMLVIGDDLGEVKYERVYRNRAELSLSRFMDKISQKGKGQNRETRAKFL